MQRVRAGFTFIFISAATALPVQGAQNSAAIPNFSPDSSTGWLKPPGDEFIQPESGPGPVKADTSHPYISNAIASQETVKIADLTNPILQPWAIEKMRQENEAVLAGKIGFTARSRCWPHGVPGFLLYPVHPIIFIQTPTEVLMTWGQDFQLRHVYLDVPHSQNLKPSWYGESVGHYENGDTLVVDTIGMNDRTYVDNYRTPHTTQLHVVERFRIVNGTAMEVRVRVEDPGAFTTPWNAIQRYTHAEFGPMIEVSCAEGMMNDYFHLDQEPIPQANTPDF
jgi:hypothetical protein